MNYASEVQVLQPKKRFISVNPQLFFTEIFLLSFEELIQIASICILHNDMQAVIFHKRSVIPRKSEIRLLLLDDIRMVEHSEDLHFLDRRFLVFEFHMFHINGL